MRSIKVTTVKKFTKGLKNKQEPPVKKKVLILAKKQKTKVLKSNAPELRKDLQSKKNVPTKAIKKIVGVESKKENAEKKTVKEKCVNKTIKKDESVKRQKSPVKQDDTKRNKSPVKNEEVVKRLKSPSKIEEPVKGNKSPTKLDDKLTRITEQEKGVVNTSKKAKVVVKTKRKVEPPSKVNRKKDVPEEILKNNKLKQPVRIPKSEKSTARKNTTKLEQDKHEKAIRLEKSGKLEKSKVADVKIKTEPSEVPDTSTKVVDANKINVSKKVAAKAQVKPKGAFAKRKQAQLRKDKSRNNKLYTMWTGPKRHRVASLNAIAKVHCLYENESRANLLDTISIKKEPLDSPPESPPVFIKSEVESPPPTRILRCVPGLRAFGKMWDMHDTTSSDSEPEFWFTESQENRKKNQNKAKKTSPEKSKNSAESKNKSESSVTNLEERNKSNNVIKETTNTNNNKTKGVHKSKADVVKIKSEEKKPIKRRKRAEIIMDLKDMVVRKRMASLNATAILAASYSVEKRGGVRSISSESDSDTSFTDSDVSYESNLVYPPKKKCFDETIVKKEDERKLIEVRATPNKKVAVIVNQDTDVTITGVYLNSTTRSTHHEGFCSIAGMQYRISATSHTQTAATAVATETILQSSSTSQESCDSDSPPSKSYTPLDALSNMQPPAGSGGSSHHHLQPTHVMSHGEKSPGPRRHGCSSAFSAPPGQCAPPAHHHPLPGEPGYIQGYYQPAGPLISVSHGHSQPPLGKSVPLSDPSPSLTPPVQPPPAPSSTGGDSSDSEVIITSVTSAKEAQQQRPPSPPSHQYRFNHYPPAHSSYPYGYPPHYYPAPPPAPAYSHHDICYPPYSQHKYMYRRYLPPPPIGPQYYPPGSPEVYGQPHTQNSPSQQVRRENASPPPTTRYRRFCEQVVTSTSTSGGSYPQAPAGPPPPTLIDTYPPPPPSALVETYPPPPPAHYYPSYGPAPPPSCYTHSSPARPLNYINATYQGCPCPMQSCPKNVHTGPLTGDSKRSNISLVKDSMPLPPVALALPLEPASATGPPSPARGSAGMPPPPSPAGATYQPPPPKQEIPEPTESEMPEKRRKARLGKAMVRNTIAANHNTMLLMCHAPQEQPFLETVKREVESPKEVVETDQKVEENTSLPPIVVIEDSMEAKEIHPPVIEKEILQCLKVEEVEKPPTEEPSEIEILPCVKTVAENVKVKNMKRNLSVSKETTTEEPPPPKKCKSDKSSYKNLIKRMQSLVKINNGKRKLIGESRFSRVTLRRPTKRKLAHSKEELSKRQKTSKPLTASNLQNLKQSTKDIKDKVSVEAGVENKEPVRKKIITGKKNGCLLGSAAKIQENPITTATNERTPKVLPEIPVRTEKCAKVEKKEEAKRTLGRRKCKAKGGFKNLRPKNKISEVPQVITKVPRRSVQLRWSNGWTWEGTPYEGKVFINSDETIVTRMCYPAMRHEEGDKIEPRDCVLLKAGQRKNELPFVAKIAALWENPDDGEMMMSLLWYYRPEHTEQGRLLSDQPDEVFASRHKDSNSVACIEDKCYVVTFNEYCRYRKNLRRLEEGVEENGTCIPGADPYPRTHRQPPTSIVTSPDLVFFCRRVYDFRQKRIVKNPS